MTTEEFRKHAHELVDWMSWYLENVTSFPVKSPVAPGDIIGSLPPEPPSLPEKFDAIFKDFEQIILPGITHWQSPNFFAYFPANSSPPSILAEMLTATLGAQCMIWETSPAAAELEELVMNWLRDNIGLPRSFEGVIHDSASTATLASIISARERLTGYRFNEEGNPKDMTLRVYASFQTHSSVEKGVRIAGIGRKNLVKIATRSDFSMDPELLELAIEEDIRNGLSPCCVIATIATTGSTAIDPLRRIGEICSRYGIWLHVDAALGGTALLLPEYRWMIEGSEEHIDSFVFNPHKWMFTNFDCTAYFVKDAEHLIRTFEILPEYLKTRTRGAVNDYRDWGIPLGRRFRALKLWMVIRTYGLKGLQEKIREHIKLASEFADLVQHEPRFELVLAPVLNTVCFRFCPDGLSVSDADQLNEKLNHALNDTGRIYLTHTILNGRYTLRMVISQTSVTRDHMLSAWNLIREVASDLQARSE
jgi:aromatic-L-amino-acid/L-tryptophan decarboxylase